ncbi:MAG: hypothetical protein JO091_06210 [Acidobacteriaceae bacterium]|nr:hypothetical protein [Acidobacteriaceae bacterium]
MKVVVSRSTNSADGTDLSELYIVDNNLGDVMTESFGACEAEFGSSAQSAASYYSSLAQQAAAEGITYAVAAGDSGAEGCDDPSQPSATGPLSVNILASTPYTIAVGGTMFNENGNYALYWNSTNNSVQASAKTYIPENAWNESCTAANGLNPCTGGNTPALWAGGGGASTLFAKPSWQTGVPGIPNDGRRDVPDVSLTAAGHDAYLLCLRGSCTPNSRGRISFSGYGGTSAATPSFAGIMALVVQKYGRQGQATPVLYGLAAEQNLAACNASNSAADCIFNDVRVGNNAVPGEANYGSNSAAYQTTYGYDLATGLGSVNVTNLVNGWNGARNSAPHFRIFSDRPGGANNTFFGSAVFSGWAVHDTAAITTIQIAIDGASYGTATYGLARADVCAVYPGRQGCPNVGWSISVDTTQLANGAHTLEITATNTLGAHATSASSFTVANWSAANPMIVNVDVPNSSTSYTGTVAFGGWALDNAGAIGSVAIAVDGVPFGNAVYGVNRQDVCAVFPGRTGCPNVGWTFNLDTTLLADGTHRLAVSGFTQAGENTTVTTTFTTANLSASPIAITIDVPNANSGTFSGPASFGGWALTNNNTAIMSVGIYIDGVFLRNALYGVNRTDVCAAFPGRAGCPGVGWTVVVDTTLLANGSHVLDVTATNSAGLRLTKSTSFVVANSQATAPLKVFIDSPNATNATVTGLINVVGWAVDNNGPVSSVVVSVDGAPRGNASYGVASRPDVCAVFPVAACPSVGWTYSLDTTLIPDGVHLLAVTASSANGDNVTATTMITVANWTTGNPMHITIDIPSSQSPPLSGVVNVGGWAISDIAAVTSVSIAVDGDPFGPVAYGMTRTDVCGAYPGRAGCPNVGWTYALDTTLLPNGAHTLDVTATSSGGQRSTVTGSFQVANSANPLIIFIDSPAAGTYTTSQATISGWAVDQTPSVGIASVQILVDGVVYGTANSVSRPDVCAVSPGAAGCPNVGWNFVLDTTLLSNGNHSLEIRATAIDGHRETVSTPFSVVNNP